MSTSIHAQQAKKAGSNAANLAPASVNVATGKPKKKRPLAPPNLAAFIRHEASVVRIERPNGAPLTGFFVSSRGLILTAAKSLKIEQTVSIELANGDRRQGDVVATSSEGLVAIEVRALPSDGHWDSLPLAPKTTRRPRGWLVALGHAPRGHMLPTAGEVASGTETEWLWMCPRPLAHRCSTVPAKWLRSWRGK